VKEEDPWRLGKLYGLDHDDQTPTGLFRTFQVFAKLTTKAQVEGEDPASPNKLKKEMLGILDNEILRLCRFGGS
jgi:hypothetical protein